MKPEYLIIHCSATKDGAVKDWEAIRNYHVRENGWSDIGYHYGIESVHGEIVIEVGRSESEAGAHCKHAGMNKKSLGICVVGAYDVVPPSEEKLTVLRGLVKQLMKEYSIPRNRVLGHREAQLLELDRPTKTCPGLRFDMEAFRESL